MITVEPCGLIGLTFIFFLKFYNKKKEKKEEKKIHRRVHTEIVACFVLLSVIMHDDLTGLWLTTFFSCFRIVIFGGCEGVP